MVVFAQAARIKIDHLFELRQLVLNFHDLVDLLLVARHHELGTAMPHGIGHLFGSRVVVQGDRNGTAHLCRHHRPVQPGPVAPDHGDEIALGHAKVDHPQRQRLDFLKRLRPGPALPDTKLFFAIGGGICELGRISMQQRRYRPQSFGAFQRLGQCVLLPNPPLLPRRAFSRDVRILHANHAGCTLAVNFFGMFAGF